MDKFVVRTPRTEERPAPSVQPVKAFKQLTLEGLKGVVVLEDLERAKLVLSRSDAPAQDKLHQLQRLSQKTPTSSILQSSGIGAVVSAARKDPDARVAAEAERVHRYWKTYNSSKANRPSIEVRCDARTQRLRDSARAMIKEALKSTLKASQSSCLGENVDSESLAEKINDRHLSDIGAVVSTTSLGYSKGLRVDLDRFHCVMSSLRKVESNDDELGSSLEENEEEESKKLSPSLREAIRKKNSNQAVGPHDARPISSIKKNASAVRVFDTKKGKENLQKELSKNHQSRTTVGDDSRTKVDSNGSQSMKELQYRNDGIKVKNTNEDKKRNRRRESCTRLTKHNDTSENFEKTEKKIQRYESADLRPGEEKSSQSMKRKEMSKTGESNELKTEAKDMNSRDKSLLEGYKTSANERESREKSKKRRRSKEKSSVNTSHSDKKCAPNFPLDEPSAQAIGGLKDTNAFSNKQCESNNGMKAKPSGRCMPKITESKSALSTPSSREDLTGSSKRNEDIISTKSVSFCEKKRKRESESEQSHCKKSKSDFGSSTPLDESGNKSKKKEVFGPETNSEKFLENSVDVPMQATLSGDHGNTNVPNSTDKVDSARSKCSNTSVNTLKSRSQTEKLCSCATKNTSHSEGSCACLNSNKMQQVGSPKRRDASDDRQPHHIFHSLEDSRRFKDDCETFLPSSPVALGCSSPEIVPPLVDRDHTEGSCHSRDHYIDKERSRLYKKKHSHKNDRERSDRRSDRKKSETCQLTDGEKFEVLSEAIERELFSENSRLINKRYKKTIRRIVFTLKHQDRIRKKVLTGKYSAGRVLSKCWDE